MILIKFVGVVLIAIGAVSIAVMWPWVIAFYLLGLGGLLLQVTDR